MFDKGKFLLFPPLDAAYLGPKSAIMNLKFNKP